MRTRPWMAEGRTTQERLSRNSQPIVTIRIVNGPYRCREAQGCARAANAARRKMQRAIQVVAAHPIGEPSKTIKHYIYLNVSRCSKRSTVESRITTPNGLISTRGCILPDPFGVSSAPGSSLRWLPDFRLMPTLIKVKILSFG
jgi:hypothetical protein